MVIELITLELIILFLLLIVVIWAIGYISEKQHNDIKEEIKKLNDKINQLKKD